MKTTNGSVDWRVLCEMASKEMDSDKLLDLVTRINVALDECNQNSLASRVGIATVISPHAHNASEHSADLGHCARI